MYSVNLAGVATQSLVSIGTNISSENASIQNASITSLSVVDFKSATFSPHTLNTSNLNVSSITIDPNFVFPVLNVSTLNSIEESFVNVSAVNISANQITCDNLQSLLTAGDNISILNNTISALNNNLPATGNFTTLNTSQINASNLSTGDLTFGSNFTLSNKFLTVNSTTNITENSGDLITSGAVFNALNKFSVNISDGRSLTSTKLIEGGDVIKPIIPGTVSSIDVDVDPSTSKNIMKVFYTTKFGPDAVLGVVANFAYVVDGFGFDKITARLEYGDGTAINNIGQGEQIWADEKGGGTRSGVLSPRIGTRRAGVSAQTTVFFQIIIQNDSTNDIFTFLNPDACTFHITESLDNAGSDLNLNTGNLQADEANFNSLTVQAGSGSGQATIGRTYLGNNAFGNMAALSVNGNDGANNYGFAQIANFQTIMNAMPTSYNSFRCENVEVASIGQIGLGIGLGVNNTAVFPLEVSGDSLVSGIMFANEIDTADADITNISNTNLSGTNATFQEINVSGNLIVNGTTFTTTNLTAGENITISNNVISAFFGSGGQVNLNHIQVDGGVDIGGVLNVSQTSNFSNSVNVGDILYAGVAGQHEGSVVLYSNNISDNYTTKINSSTFEVNVSATNNLSAINFFVGNNKSLEITKTSVNALNFSTNDFFAAVLEADVFTCIDGRATFRFNTPEINASNANFSDLVVDGTVGIGIDDPERLFHVRGRNAIWRLDRDVNSAALQLHRFDNNFVGDPLKGFIIGVNANGPNDGNFFINDYGRDVSGTSTPRFSIENDGAVIINHSLTTDVGNFSTVNTSEFTTQTANISEITIDGAQGILGLVVNSEASFTQGVFISGTLNHTASDMFLGSPSQAPNSFGGGARSRINLFGTNPSSVGEIGMRFGVHEDYTAGAKIGSFGGVERFNIEFNDVDCFDLDNISTTIHNKLNASNISSDKLTADTTTITNANSDFLKTFHFNLSDQGSLGLATTFERATDTTITSPVGSIIFNTKPNSTARAMIISQNNVVTTRTIQNVGLMETRNFSVDENVSVTGSLTANDLEVMNNVNVTGTLTATNIPGFQKELTAGNNISILNNVISTEAEPLPTNPNFSSVTANTVTVNDLDADNIVGGSIASLTYNISNNLDQAEASVLFRDGNVTQLLHSGGRVRFDCNSIETSVGNFSTINASVINGANLSTASIAFGSDFNYDTFSNTLTLAQDAGQAIADELENGIETTSVNTSTLNVDGLTTLDAVAVSVELNALVGNLNTINSSGTANISVINNSTLNSITGNFSTINASNIKLEDSFVHFRIPLVIGGGFDSFNTGAVFLICLKDGGDNECVGKFYYQRSSGHDGAGVVDIVVSSRASVDDIPHGFCSYQTTRDNGDSITIPHRFKMITGTFSGQEFIALLYEGGDTFPFTECYFDGLLKTTGTNTPFQVIKSEDFTTQEDLPIGETNELSLINKRFVIDSNGAVIINTINSSGTANISVINNSTLNSITGNFSTINASNIVGYQETLIAGDNITITGNTISATGGGTLPADANFSSVNIINDTTPTLEIKTSTGGSGRVIFGNANHGVGRGLKISTLTDGNDVVLHTAGSGSVGLITGGAERLRINNNGFMTVTNQVRFRARRTSGTTFTTNGGTLPYDQVLENVGGGYNNSTFTFTAPITGRYYFYGQFFSNGDNSFRVDFFSGNTRIRRISRESSPGAGGNTTFSASFYHPLNAGQTMRMLLDNGSVKVVQNEFSHFGGYLLG